MNTTILIWIFVSAFLLALILIRMADERMDATRKKKDGHRLKLLEIGKEREEFFIAGDPTSAFIKDDYDDIDD